MQRNRQKRRVVLFDALEGRELLSGVAAPAAEVHAIKILNSFKGTIKGSFQISNPGPSETFSLSGQTKLGTLGPATVTGTFQQQSVQGAISAITGTATIATSQGPVNLNYSGSSSGAKGKENVNIAGSVNANLGALGNFAGAFTANGPFKFNSAQSGTFTLTIKAHINPV